MKKTLLILLALFAGHGRSNVKGLGVEGSWGQTYTFDKITRNLWKRRVIVGDVLKLGKGVGSNLSS